VVAGTAHPALEFNQHQLIGAINEGDVCHRAVSVATMVKGDPKVFAAEAADLWITAHHNPEGGT